MDKEAVDKILDLLGISQEELNQLTSKKKVTLSKRKKKVTLPPAYVIQLDTFCSLCKHKQKRFFHMKPCEASESLVSIEVNKAPKGIPVQNKTEIVKTCTECFEYLMGVDKPNLVLMYLQTKNQRGDHAYSE